MILDTIANTEKYSIMHVGFAPAFAFLKAENIQSLKDGRYEIDGDRVYAIVSRENGKGKCDAVLETHKAYIDIQYIVEGADVIGWKPLAACKTVKKEYDAVKDIKFYCDTPDTWCTITPGNFAVFFPQDAHAPLAGEGSISKIIIKIQA